MANIYNRHAYMTRSDGRKKALELENRMLDKMLQKRMGAFYVCGAKAIASL